GVGGAVAGGSAERAGEVDGDLPHIGAGKVIDHNVVCGAQCLELDAFDAIEVHLDIGDVAEEERVGTDRRNADVLDDVGAAKVKRIEAASAIDGIAAVARVPDEPVVAGVAEEHVVAAAADDDVVSGAAEQYIVSLAADDRVVAGAAIDRQLD